MNLRGLFVVVAMLSTSTLASPAASEPGDRGVSLVATAANRSASLLEGVTLDATLKPSQAPALALLDGLRFGLGSPLLPLAQGAAVEASTKPILALVLGLVLGLGIGHYFAGDQANFVLFLIVDLALIAADVVLSYTLLWGISWIAYVALLASHIYQGLDAYAKAGGQKIVEWTRENAVEVASSEERGVPITTRAFALQF